MQSTGGARAKARSAEPCAPASLRRARGGRIVADRAATLRRASGAKARSAEPASGFLRQGAVRGRAAWPRLRRHLAGKISHRLF